MTVLVLKERIRLAFDNVPIPPPDALPDDFRITVAGRHWATLPTAYLFLHRASIADFAPPAFVAYIAAYMTNGLIDGPYETDLLACALKALTPERDSCFDEAQRIAVALFREHAGGRLGEAGIRNYARQRRSRQLSRD